MGYIVAAIIAFFFLSRQGGFSLGGSTYGGSALPPPPATPVAPTVGNTLQNENQAATAAGNARNAIPIVGPALSQTFTAIKNALFQASAQRAKLAINENVAVGNAVPGWDAAMTQVQTGYNNGSLSASQAAQLVDLAWANYWSEVGNAIQPGRNGCQSGSLSKQQADKQFPGLKQCSGDWGAACCVGYAALANGAVNIKAAIALTENSGKSAPAYITSISASKYGGINRAAYTLTFTRPSSVFTI